MREDDELQVLGAESKQKSRRRWVLGFLGFVAVITIVTGLGLIVRYAIKGALDFDEELMRNDGLRPSGDTTIIPALQDAADSLLNDKLTEIDGLQGQVIVMEVQTGRILAMVGLERNFEGKF
jgi:cell division protein FtsI (penicillin-binding protein 3)